jgi:hypothetical protein
MSVTLRGIRELLQRHGPLWTHGQSHVVVITGVDEAREQLYVYDPAPLNIGCREWRSYPVLASFLYHP